jgi:hypothetical protein
MRQYATFSLRLGCRLPCLIIVGDRAISGSSLGLVLSLRISTVLATPCRS